MKTQALIFDVDGTLAETEDAHRRAFNQAFAEFDLNWHWDPPLYGLLLKVSGGKERMRAFEQNQSCRVPSDDLDSLINTVHRRKTEIYTGWVANGAIALRPGILPLIAEARAAGLRLAIATTTTRANVVALIAGTGLQAHWFETMACSDDAPFKKPHPQVYELVLSRLDLPAPLCLAIEDSSNGVAAAAAAGIPVVMTPSAFTGGDSPAGAKAVWPDLDGVSLSRLTA